MLAVAIFLSGCGKQEQPEGEVIRPAKIYTVGEAEDKQIREFPAQVAAQEETLLSFEISGKIVELPLISPADVKAGDLIAKLDQTDAKSKLSDAQSRYDTAKADFDRADRLFKEDAIAKSVLDERKAQLVSAEAQLATAKKAFDDTEIHAPYEGMIAKIPVELNQTVTAGQDIAIMFDPKKLQVKANVPASMVADSPGRGDREAIVMLSDLPDKRIPATFKEAIAIADVSSQTFEAIWIFEAPEDVLIFPNMNARIELSSKPIEAEEKKVVFSLPLGAVNPTEEGHFVWLVNEDMSLTKQSVEIKEHIGEKILISEGLKRGDRVVSAGAAILKEGMKVRPWELQRDN